MDEDSLTTTTNIFSIYFNEKKKNYGCHTWLGD
jgi:hypothetical protein